MVASNECAYREFPFRLPQILERVVVDRGLLDVVFDIIFVRHVESREI